MELRDDGSFRIGDLEGTPMMVGTWAFTSGHLMLVVPAGGCASAPKLGRLVAVLAEHEQTLYHAMPSTVAHQVRISPETGCPAYDDAGVEMFQPAEPLDTAPAGVWQGHRMPGLHCTGFTNQ